MATDVILPRVDMDMTTGRVSHWFVKAGETVAKGAPLFEIETDKAAMEIEAPASGRVQITVGVGEQVPVGSTVGWILAEGEGDVAGAAVAETEAPVAELADSASPTLAEATATGSDVETAPAPSTNAPSETAIRATPLSRRIAAEHGVDLAEISGSGPKGRIHADDVTAFVAERGQPTATVARAPMLRTPTPSGAALNGVWLRQGADAASSGETLVLIHGFGSDLGGWRPFVQGLPATLPIYAVDLPGHGASPLTHFDGIDDIATDVVASLASVGITSGHVVGHSLGGAVATALAAGGQFDARSLFLLSPGGLGPEVNARFIEGFARATSESALGAWMGELIENADIMTLALVKATAKARAGSSLVETLPYIAARLFPEGTQGFSIRSSLKTLGIPARVVFGRADRIIPASHADALPGSVAVHKFAGVGHLPHYEARDEVARLLLQHIKSAG
jgi:pyruvate dehydrogenase E2 component (dihydrolipoamide acetyltransferase)